MFAPARVHQASFHQRVVIELAPCFGCRDLQTNWSVDIAAELEVSSQAVQRALNTRALQEYLAELETIAVSFDNGRTVLNFAEGARCTTHSCACSFVEPTAAAALLIQGSACVHSKKVEYLHSLVDHTLEIIIKQKCAQQLELEHTWAPFKTVEAAAQTSANSAPVAPAPFERKAGAICFARNLRT